MTEPDGTSHEGTAFGSRIVVASLLMLAACVAYVLLTAGGLPDPMVSQVGLKGNPTGWMGRTTFLVVLLAFLAGLNGLFWILRPLLRITPDNMINTPWHGYWFATPARRAVAIRRLEVMLVGQTGFYLNATFLLAYHMIRQTNVPNARPHLPDWSFLPILGVGTAAFITWVILHMKPPAAGKSRTSQ